MTSTTLTKGGGVAPDLAGTTSGSKASARKRAGVASSRFGEKSGEGKKRVRDDRVAAAIFLIPTFVGFFVGHALSSRQFAQMPAGREMNRMLGITSSNMLRFAIVTVAVLLLLEV